MMGVSHLTASGQFSDLSTVTDLLLQKRLGESSTWQCALSEAWSWGTRSTVEERARV